jgi:hypothetical protein
LRDVVDNLAPLRSFMLLTPGADFLEREALKLPSASDAFRHVYVEEYQHSEKMWGASRSSLLGRIRARCSLRLAARRTASELALGFREDD